MIRRRSLKTIAAVDSFPTLIPYRTLPHTPALPTLLAPHSRAHTVPHPSPACGAINTRSFCYVACFQPPTSRIHLCSPRLTRPLCHPASRRRTSMCHPSTRLLPLRWKASRRSGRSTSSPTQHAPRGSPSPPRADGPTPPPQAATLLRGATCAVDGTTPVRMRVLEPCVWGLPPCAPHAPRGVAATALLPLPQLPFCYCLCRSPGDACGIAPRLSHTDTESKHGCSNAIVLQPRLQSSCRTTPAMLRRLTRFLRCCMLRAPLRAPCSVC